MNRREALDAGVKEYTGKICIKHPELKGLRTTTQGCQKCSRENALKQYYADPEKAKAKHKAWSEKNLERKKELYHRWYEKNQEEHRAYQRARVDQDVRTQAFGNILGRCRNTGIPCEISSWQELPPRPDCCPFCGVEFERRVGSGTLPASPSIDRTNPARGYTLGNINWMCVSCNCRKHTSQNLPKK